jgi:hypothetical protein
VPPVIAVSAGFPAYGDYMGLAYARPLEAAGALPVQLPFLADPAAVLAVADGVLLGFGSDIDPARYGGAPHPSMTAHSERRDAFELALARAAPGGSRPSTRGTRCASRRGRAWRRRSAPAPPGSTPTTTRASTGSAPASCRSRGPPTG